VIGIDGFTKATYEAARVGSDRDVVYANVERLLALRREQADGPEIQVQFIAMADNAHEMQPFCDYWLQRGATLKVRNQLSWGGKFQTPLAVPAADRIPCPWALTMMHVFWDGRVPRCPGDTEGEEGVGNAWEVPLSELWARLGGYRELHLQHRFDELPPRCWHARLDDRCGAAHPPRRRAPRVTAMRKLYLCGAGNSEGVRLAQQINARHPRWDHIVLLDDDPAKLGSERLGVPVVGRIDACTMPIRRRPSGEPGGARHAKPQGGAQPDPLSGVPFVPW